MEYFVSRSQGRTQWFSAPAHAHPSTRVLVELKDKWSKGTINNTEPEKNTGGKKDSYLVSAITI